MVISLFPWEIVMLEKYYIRPTTMIASASPGSVPQSSNTSAGWQSAAMRLAAVSRRIPVMVSFGEFAKARGASKIEDLPDHVEPFVQAWIGDHAGGRCSARRRKQVGDQVRNPIRQMLRLAVWTPRTVMPS
jgi:integrase/recombinase XerD